MHELMPADAAGVLEFCFDWYTSLLEWGSHRSVAFAGPVNVRGRCVTLS